MKSRPVDPGVPLIIADKIVDLPVFRSPIIMICFSGMGGLCGTDLKNLSNRDSGSLGFSSASPFAFSLEDVKNVLASVMLTTPVVVTVKEQAIHGREFAERNVDKARFSSLRLDIGHENVRGTLH